MSKILSYNKKTTGEGWISLPGQYNADEINMISDPNGGLSVKPRTAIPSPFANMDLVKNAYRRLSMNPRLEGESMDERLVSYSLDVAQMFFNLPNLEKCAGLWNAGGSCENAILRVTVWSKEQSLPLLFKDDGHRLLGETLKMFLEQDKEAFNFARMDKVFFLVLGNDIVGSTSPVTLFMASPNAQPDKWNIPIEQGETLYGNLRPLYKRTPRFILYLYALFTAYPQLKSLCSEVNEYLITCFSLLSADLQQAILANVGNPSVQDTGDAAKALQFLQQSYVLLDGNINVLGVPLYSISPNDILQDILSSDFLIKPTLKQPEGSKLPLVLSNQFESATGDTYRYVTASWSDKIIIRPVDYSIEPNKRILPGMSYQYPWLTADDFFQPSLLKLDFALNGDSFFDGHLTHSNLDIDSNGFLLPLRDVFFRYFTTNDLRGTICGRPCFEMIHSSVAGHEQVRVVLRVPVQKQGGYITLERVYIPAVGVDLRYSKSANVGYFLTVPFALSIFPFVRNDFFPKYRVQVVDRALGLLENYSLSLQFHSVGNLAEKKTQERKRSLKREKRVGSIYYCLDDTFDYIEVQLIDDRGSMVSSGVACPIWPVQSAGHEEFTFAVDFGTTNTHVEYMQGNDLPEPLAIDATNLGRLVATLYNGNHLLYDVILKQEFLPKRIGNDYGFPQRTVLSESENLDAESIDDIVALGDANIPFIYEKESVGYGNRIIANLKWSTDLAANKRVKCYLTELALLMRAHVLLHGGDLAKTRLIWFYPLAMKVGNIRRMGDMWSRIFQNVFGISSSAGHLLHMPESVAPYYFYRCSSKFRGAASTVASIDIGGGSSDVVVFDSNADQPSILTSFRFAANALFGDAFSEVPHGDTNPMLTKYVAYFRRLFDADDDSYGELNGILDDIMAKRKSEDINAFLFSVIDNKMVRGNDVFSYDMRLAEDGRLKIVFIYFYSALIYYVALMMHHFHLAKPRSVMFSGTGSKVLDIVGGQRDLDMLSQAIFERIYGEQYGENGFSIVMERSAPKQITCRGALMQVRDSFGCASVDRLNNQLDSIHSPIILNYSVIGDKPLTYADMDDVAVRKSIVDAVKVFNTFFEQLCTELQVEDRFLVDVQSMQHFKQLVNRDLDHYLINGWNFVNKNEANRNATDTIEDAVFFYPIIGCIRDNLIEHLLD